MPHKVLLVDDDKAMTSLLKTLLELEDFQVEIIAKGKEAADVLPGFKPDIVLVDYHLKDMNGLELVDYIRGSDFSDIPIIMVSGLDVEDEAMNAGVDQFILKPFEPADLPGILLDLIGQ